MIQEQFGFDLHWTHYAIVIMLCILAYMVYKSRKQAQERQRHIDSSHYGTYNGFRIHSVSDPVQVRIFGDPPTFYAMYYLYLNDGDQWVLGFMDQRGNMFVDYLNPNFRYADFPGGYDPDPWKTLNHKVALCGKVKWNTM